MKKLICLATTLALLASTFAVGASAALPTFRTNPTADVFTEDFSTAIVGQTVKAAGLTTICNSWADQSNSQHVIKNSGDEAYGLVVNMKGIEGKSASATMGFGDVADCKEYTVEFDLKANYASAPFSLMIPWGDYTQHPAYFMLAPQLFTDVDLQADSTNATFAAMPEESLATGKWYHIEMTVDNAAMKAMTKYDAATTLKNVTFKVTDLATNETVVPAGVTAASPHTDSVSAHNSVTAIMSLLGNKHIGMGLYTAGGHNGYVKDSEGGNNERYKVDYFVDNVKFAKTPDDTTFETKDVILEERAAVNQTAALGKSWNLPGGAIGAYDAENPDANIGDGYDAFNFVVTFDMATDCDVVALEMYGKNVKNVSDREAVVNTTDDGGQARMFRIPVEEAARGKKFSYKVVNGQYTMYVYRAEFGSDEYSQVSDVKIANGASNATSSMVRFMFHKNYGTTLGTYVDYENLMVVNKGAMAITNKNDSTVEIAFETGNSEKAFPILAFFDGMGRLVDTSTPGEGEIANGEGTATFDITDKAYETAQIFLWNSAEGLAPIAEIPWVID